MLFLQATLGIARRQTYMSTAISGNKVYHIFMLAVCMLSSLAMSGEYVLEEFTFMATEWDSFQGAKDFSQL